MLKKKKSESKNMKPMWLFSILGTTVLLFLIISSTYLTNFGKILPNVLISNVQVGRLTKEEALSLLEKNALPPKEISYAISGGPISSEKLIINLSDINFSYDLNESVNKAYSIGRSGLFKNDFFQFLKSRDSETNLGIDVKFDEEKFNEYLSTLVSQTEIEPIYPSAKIANGTAVIETGKKGYVVNFEKIKESTLYTLKNRKSFPITLPVDEIDPHISETDAKEFEKRVTNLIGKNLTLNYENQSIELKDSDLASFLNYPTGYKENLVEEKIKSFKTQVDIEAKNPSFVFENDKVKEFSPAIKGINLNLEKTKHNFLDSLSKLESEETKKLTVLAAATETEPSIKTGDINNLGIKEIIGVGTSKFRGSIASRVHNVALASSRINGTLIKPGETFSFNQALGDVSKLTGYKEAYVISEGKTVLGDGGGVCQVSTTLFRAAMNAGLPIVERRGHSYRVGYYEQDAPPGLDATVYSPTTDFKFKNDTPGYILIQTKADTKNLSLLFELYGTKDGRVSTVGKPVISDVVTPPDDLYMDDPTLPIGTVKQIEHKAVGSKSKFSYEVKRDGQVIYSKDFLTVYRPWQAVFLKGTAPIQ